MKIKFSNNFVKSYNRAPEKIRKSFDLRLKLFIQDKNYPLLKNHKLRGKLSGYRSINISGDWRAIFKEEEDGNLIFFLLLGTHSQLYS